MKIINYSEKALALVGDTQPIKEQLKALKGVYNPNLTVDGQRTKGWIFSRKREAEIRLFLNKADSHTTAIVELPAPPKQVKAQEAKPAKQPDTDKLFLSLAKKICKKSVIPACDFIHFGGGVAMATNIKNFVTINSPEYGSVLTSDIDKSLTWDNGQPYSDMIKLSVHNVNNAPDLPKLGETKEYFFSNEDRLNIIAAMDFIGKDEIRPVMSQVVTDQGHIVATDAHRLFFKPTKAPDGFRFTPFTMNLLKEIKGGFKASTDGKYTVIESNGVTLYSEAIEGIYPNWQAVVPEDNPFKIVMPVKELSIHIEKAVKAANKTTKQVILSFGARLIVEGHDADRGTEYKGEMYISTTVFRIGFNGSLLLQVLKHCGETVTFEASTPNRAALFNGILLMPVKI